MRKSTQSVEPDPDALELQHTRQRRPRSRRTTIGAVAVVAAIGVAAVASSVVGTLRGQNPATPIEETPTVAPEYPGQVGLIGLAPKGATPSSPSRGELVLAFTFGHTMGDHGRFSVHVYADGRLISQRLGDPSGEGDATGIIEQRLTREGVELVRSEVLSTGLFDRDTVHFVSAHGLSYGQIEVRDGDRLVRLTWGDIHPMDEPMTVPTPEQASALERLDERLEDLAWLPTSAWEDPEMGAFVPSRYAVCLETEQEVGIDAVLASLPQPAEDLLRKRDRTAENFNGLFWWCSAVTTEEARGLAQIVEDTPKASLVRNDVFGLAYAFGRRDPSTTDVRLSFEPMLPHDS
jgi:hypothetical protein